jgi:activator of HSP90 ATPase
MFGVMERDQWREIRVCEENRIKMDHSETRYYVHSIQIVQGMVH